MKKSLLFVIMLLSVFTLSAQQVALDAKGRVVPESKIKRSYTKDAQFAFKAKGEYSRHELSFAYGWATIFPIVGWTAEVVSLSLYKGDLRFTGSANLEYLYHVHRAVGVGLTLSCEYGKQPKDADFTSHHHYISAMPTVKIYWIVHDNYALYTRCAIGATYITGEYKGERDNKWLFASQLSLCGFEAGNKRVRGFIEIGGGMQGSVIAGLRTKF